MMKNLLSLVLIAMATGCASEASPPVVSTPQEPAPDDASEPMHAEAIANLCASVAACDVFESNSGCLAFFEQVFTDLEAGCDSPSTVEAAYIDALDCMAAEVDAQGCSVITAFDTCRAEYDEYEARKAADGPSCEPEDD